MRKWDIIFGPFDSHVFGHQVVKRRGVSGNLFSQEIKDRVSEVGAHVTHVICGALRPAAALDWDEMQLDSTLGPRQRFLHELAVISDLTSSASATAPVLRTYCLGR